MKVLIVEDEVLIAEDIKDTLNGFGITQVEMVHDKKSALAILPVFLPQIVLLDIRMEGSTDGIEIAEYIRHNLKIPYIFITSHSDVGMIREIVKTNPAGYITKPFKKSDLFAQLNLVELKIGEQNRSVKVKDGYTMHVISHNDIHYIKSDGNYIDIFHEGKKITCRMSLESILAELNDARFFKISKSYIVNITRVSSYNSREAIVNGTPIAISRHVMEQFETMMRKS